MKPGAKVVLVGALLIVLATLSSMTRGAGSDAAWRNRGACCPFMGAPDTLPLPSVTNGTTINCKTSTPAATNRL
jgi:hypothetical protein